MKRKLLCLLLVLSLVLCISIPGYAASSMKASDDCLSVIKGFEGFSSTPYRDTDGHYTIGYGTRCPNDKVEYYRNNPMTKAEADAELRKEIVTFETAVNSFMDRHGISLNQGQFDGLISLVFNCGVSWLTKGETLIEAVKQGYTSNDLIYTFAIYSMNAGKRSIGHVKRRLAEANMFLNQSYSSTPPANYCYVLYDANGGELSTYNVQGYDANTSIAPVNTATYSGKSFLGWYTKASGGVQVAKLDASTNGLTLYARWGTGTQPPAQEQPQIITPDADVSKITGSFIPSGDAITPVRVTVTATSLNLRKGPGTGYEKVGSAKTGEQFTVDAVRQGGEYLWGRYGDGWLCLDYTTYTAPAASKTYGVVDVDALNVRDEPEGAIVGKLTRGTRVEILEQRTVFNRVWGRYTGGWICMTDYVLLEGETQVAVQTAPVPNAPLSAVEAPEVTEAQVTASCLNVRIAPGVGNAVVDWLYRDEPVRIVEYVEVKGTPWGRIDRGWICLRYVK